jgi:hypothetical protein
MTSVAGGVAALLLVALTVLASKGGEAPEPVISKNLISAQSTQQQPSGPVSTGMMVPRPSSAQELASRSDVIVLGTIRSIIAEKMIGPYGEDGNPTSAGEEGGTPYTDYEVQIESVLKGDDAVTGAEPLVLRMFGHLSNRDAIITSVVFTLPSLGDHLLFALGRNPDGTYGSGPEGLINVDGDTVVYADGVPFTAGSTGGMTPDQLIQEIEG